MGQPKEALSAWTTAHRARHVVYRVVGERWDPRTHVLRDMLTRNSVPFEFYPVGSRECDRLVGDFGVDVDRLPALIRHNGTVLQDPTFSEVATSHGIRTRPSPKLYVLAIMGAEPAGLAAAVYGASEGLGDVLFDPLVEASGRALGQAGPEGLDRPSNMVDQRTPIVRNSRFCIHMGFLSTFGASEALSESARGPTRTPNGP